jgi:hypothetical protein
MKSFFKMLIIVITIFLPAVPAQENILFCNADYQAEAELPLKQFNSKIINVPAQLVITIGVSETKDAAALFFKMYESYLKASEDGVVNFSDLQYLLGPAMLLIPAFSGASQIVNELAALTDEQIKVLLLVADEYELGEHAQRAKQVFKSILTLAQTYFVFEAAASR